MSDKIFIKLKRNDNNKANLNRSKQIILRGWNRTTRTHLSSISFSSLIKSILKNKEIKFALAQLNLGT